MIFSVNMHPFSRTHSNLAWRQTPETGSGVVAFTDLAAQLKCKITFIGTRFATYSNIHTLPGVQCLSPVHCFINLTGKFEICMYEIMSDARICFKRRRGQPCRWLSGTDNWVRAHVGDVIIVWRKTHNNTEPNAIWFPATLTDTDLNIQGIQVKYRTNGNCNTPATESRLWGTKWYYLFSAQVCMLCRWAFGIFYTTTFNWTFKNCVSRRGSSKG